MTRRLVAVVLTRPVWTPPGVDQRAWRLALAEDLLDVLARMVEVDAAVVVGPGETGLRSVLGWPGMRWYDTRAADVTEVLAAIAAEGEYDHAALVAADAPDLPGLHLAKLLRPLTTRPVAVAPATDGPTGVLGLACHLPAPPWLPAAPLDGLTVARVRAAAPRLADVAVTAGWHRLRAPDTLDRLDPRLEGWEATRLLLPSRSG